MVPTLKMKSLFAKKKCVNIQVRPSIDKASPSVSWYSISFKIYNSSEGLMSKSKCLMYSKTTLQAKPLISSLLSLYWIELVTRGTWIKVLLLAGEGNVSQCTSAHGVYWQGWKMLNGDRIMFAGDDLHSADTNQSRYSSSMSLTPSWLITELTQLDQPHQHRVGQTLGTW